MPDSYSPAERRQLAAIYAAGVMTALQPAATRSLHAPFALEPWADLLPVSRDLTAAARAGLAGSDPLDVAAAEVQLLAGAALDLTLAGHLTGAVAPQVRGYAVELASAQPDKLLPDVMALQAIIQAPEAYLAGSAARQGGWGLATRGRQTRGPAAPASELADAAHAALASIRGDVVTTGGHTVEGLLLLDAALLKEALNTVGRDLAGKLGLELVGFGAKALDFLLAANEKLLALIGLDVMREARSQLARWLDQLRAGTLFPSLMDRVLRTRTIEAEIKGWLAAYEGSDDALLAAAGEINQLAGQYAAKARIADKVAAGLAVAKVAPPLMTPAGRIAIAAIYLGLLAYVIGAGYDHVDSDRIRLLDRVEGVRGISQRVLAPPAQKA